LVAGGEAGGGGEQGADSGEGADGFAADGVVAEGGDSGEFGCCAGRGSENGPRSPLVDVRLPDPNFTKPLPAPQAGERSEGPA